MSSQKKKPSIGIDLGTTYSCVAVFQQGRVEVIANGQGSRITPSVVAFTERGRIVGEGAEVHKTLDPENTVYSAKRFIGGTPDDPAVQDNKAKYPFKIVDNGETLKFEVEFQKSKKLISPEEVSAAVLAHMKKMAEEYLEEAVEEAVITVPAYFSNSQRQATMDAAQIAGLKVKRIINEPTAASMAYNLQENLPDGSHILVYDLGGGTFDVSVLCLDEDVLEVKATGGDPNLGGDDFNVMLARHFQKEVSRKYNWDVSSNQRATQRLTEACEKLKRNLSAGNTMVSHIELGSFLPDGSDFCASLSRAKFEDLCKDEFKKTTKIVEQVLLDAKVIRDQISEVVLVGGSTRIPKIRAMLAEMFPYKPLNKSVNPDEAVACGAAIQAAILNHDQHHSIRDTLLMDVTPLSLGLDIYGDKTSVKIKRNTSIPVKKTFEMVTAVDNQTEIRFSATEGERAMTKDNKILGSFNLSNIPPGRPGQEKCDVTFDINSDGILTVTATHKGNRGNTGSMKIDARTSGRLTDEEVNAMIETAEEMKLEDEAEERRVNSLCRLEALCGQVKLKAKEIRPYEAQDELQDLLEAVSHCLTWIRANQDASMLTFESKFAQILEKANAVFPNQEDFRVGYNKSIYVFDMSHATAKSFIDQAECDLRNNNLKCAYEGFQNAYNVASKKGKVDKMVTALQRMGYVRRLEVEQGRNKKKDVEMCTEGAIRIAYAFEVGERRSLLNRTQREELAGDLFFLSTKFFEAIAEFTVTGRQKMSENFLEAISISHPVEDISWNKVIFNCHISHLRLYLGAIKEKLEREDFKEALNDISGLMRSQDQASRLASTKAEKKTLKGLLQELEDCNKLGMGLMLVHQAEETMKQDKDNSVERAFVALDLISEAKNLTKQVDMRYFCKAKLHEGQLLLNLFLNKDKAKACLKEVIDISVSERYTDSLWFKEASALFQKIKKEEETPEIPSEEKEDCMKDLRSEIKGLDAAERFSDGDFINFLFSKFPPKHHSNPKKPDVQNQNFATLKRAFAKLSGYYHPDKVDTSIHGEKHKVLCEEIAKRVNARYAQLKGED